MNKKIINHGGGEVGGIYGLAFIGALIYYLQNADSLWTGLVGLFKAIFWPAFLIYELFQYLQM